MKIVLNMKKNKNGMLLNCVGELLSSIIVHTYIHSANKTSLESDKPWPGSPFSVIWFKTTGPVWNIKEDKG